jgi:hypothetical protein
MMEVGGLHSLGDETEGEDLAGNRVTNQAILERLNLLQRALVELNEKAIGGLKEFFLLRLNLNKQEVQC